MCSTDTSCFWQTVSTGSQTVPFSWKNSIVVCRELGYFDNTKYVSIIITTVEPPFKGHLGAVCYNVCPLRRGVLCTEIIKILTK